MHLVLAMTVVIKGVISTDNIGSFKSKQGMKRSVFNLHFFCCVYYQQLKLFNDFFFFFSCRQKWMYIGHFVQHTEIKP